jgi:hypothetical protein
LGTSYFELSEEAVGITKGVFINLSDLATTGYVQLRKIEFIKTGYYNTGDKSVEIDKYSAWVLCSDPVFEETLTLFTLEESQKTAC